jgi:hypothetical protein
VLRLATDPIGFLKSPSSSGEASILSSQNPAKSTKGLSDLAIETAASYLPFGDTVLEGGKILSGNAMPGQNMSWADRVAAIVGNIGLGGHFSKNLTPKQERTEAKKIRKGQGL